MPSTRKRSLVKAVTYRVSSTGFTMLFVYLITRELSITLYMLAFDFVFMTGWYFVHERLWKLSQWGKI
jgi:adenylylsulfate kinase